VFEQHGHILRRTGQPLIETAAAKPKKLPLGASGNVGLSSADEGPFAARK